MLLHGHLQCGQGGTRKLHVQRRRLTFIAFVLFIVATSTGATSPDPSAGRATDVCPHSPSWIIAEVEAGSGTFVVGPTGASQNVPVPPALVSAVTSWQQLRSVPASPRWEVVATSDDGGYAFTVVRPGGITVMQAGFARRIELAASETSLSGRFTIFVQANNVATEVTILDALRVQRWTALLPHDASLAAFAISIHIDPAEGCLAISEQRATDEGPQTWYIDLVTREVSDPAPGFVVAWFG